LTAVVYSIITFRKQSNKILVGGELKMHARNYSTLNPLRKKEKGVKYNIDGFDWW